MYSVFIAVQYLGIIVLVAEILYIYRQKSSQLQTLMLTVAVSTLINFIGYLFEMRATTQELALQAVKFIYLGKPYILLGTFLFIIQYYKVKCPPWVKGALCCLHIGITVLVLECERIPWYYSSIGYTYDGYFPHLVLGKGFAYLIYSGMIVVYLTVILVLGVIHYRRTADKVERKRIVYLSGASVISAAGLLQTDYDVDMATSAKEAMTLIYKNVPDLIFLDYDMPQCDGKMTFEMFKNDSISSDIPVVFLTGVTEKNKVLSVLNMYPADYLVKPVDKGRVMETIHNVFEQ